MAHQYTKLVFTDNVKQVQREQNSRDGYATMEHGEDYNFLLSENEANFISERDSFYMASVGETGWPYVQHRGGPIGFMRVLDERRLGFADFSGNRQYVSTGNFRSNDRVSLFFMDYRNQRRLKMMGRIELVADDDWDTLAQLEVEGYPASVERGFIIHIEGFDWNCPKFITPRFTENEVEQILSPILSENEQLKAQVAKLQSRLKNSDGNVLSGEDKSGEKLSDQYFDQEKLRLEITSIRQLTPRIRAYELRHPERLDLPKVSAGSHLLVPIELDSGESIERCYSICSNPARRDVYEIAILREEEGSGGSKAIHQKFKIGQLIYCSKPKNLFEVHDDDRPTILIAAGIGITPIKAMAQQLSRQKKPFEMHYAGRSLEEMAFQERLKREFGDTLTLYSAEESQRMNCAEILRNADVNSMIYVCGPMRLINDLVETAKALGIDPSRIRSEAFSAQLVESDEAAKKDKIFTVELVESDLSITVEPDKTVLDAIEEQGIAIPNSCHAGICRSCIVTVVEGEVEHRDLCLTEDEQKTLMCPCVSRAKGSQLKLSL
ncbi:2Fe-2S iron-sulfur cluster-binding protein [Vibrio kyushuensis]|uniref:2Fe-2S iron-sulfur cluster-binding protein n=1 Tax=Vibrio kyushuensis TaxID=2910249 RepID=UPI003D0A19B2